MSGFDHCLIVQIGNGKGNFQNPVASAWGEIQLLRGLLQQLSLFIFQAAILLNFPWLHLGIGLAVPVCLAFSGP